MVHNPNEAFGLPTGTVRALLALIIVVSTVLAFFLVRVIPPELSTLAGLVIGFYFGQKAQPVPPAGGS